MDVQRPKRRLQDGIGAVLLSSHLNDPPPQKYMF